MRLADLRVYSETQLLDLKKNIDNSSGTAHINKLLTIAEAYSQFNTDSAIAYAFKTCNKSIALRYNRGYCKSMYCMALANAESKPIRQIIPVFKQCTNWFESNNYEKDALFSRIAYTKCLKLSHGLAAARIEAEETLKRAIKLKNDQLIGCAWFDIYKYKPAMIAESKYPNSIDSALFYLNKAKDSSNILEVLLYNTLPINGSYKAFNDAFEALKISNNWHNNKLSFRAAMHVGLCYAGIRKVDSSKFYFEKSIAYAEKLNSKDLIMQGNQKISYAYYLAGQVDQSIFYSEKALITCRENDYNYFSQMLLSRNASCYLKLNKNEVAIKLVLQALKLSKKHKDEFSTNSLRRLLGGLYKSTWQYEKSKEIYMKSLIWAQNNLSNKVQARTLSNTYGELGQLELEQGNIDTGMMYLEKATGYDTIMTNRFSIEAKVALISAYLDLNNIHRADSIYNYIGEHYSKRVIKQSKSFDLIAGRILIAKKEYQPGIEALNDFLNKSKNKILNPDKQIVYFQLYKGYNALNEHENALEAFVKYKAISDSINTNQSAAKVSQIESNYEITLKESTISDLKRQQELQFLRLIQQENQLELRQLYLILTVLGAIVIIIIGYLFFRRYRQKKEREKIEMKAKRAELELDNLLTKQKAEISELKNELFANVSHEFRTPLTLIQVPIKTFIEKADDKDKPMLESVLKNTNQLLDMVDELLDLRKMKSGVVKLNYSVFQLSDIFSEAETYFSPLFKQKNITSNWTYKPADIQIKGYRKRLKIVLNNLLKNAYNHTPENGKIMVFLDLIESKGHKEIKCQVKNTGKGILQKDIPKIFDRYYRSNEADYVGNGIGLSLCKQIIEMHEGDINVEVNDDKIVTFFFKLPVKHIVNHEHQSVKHQVNTELPSHHLNIELPQLLIVEDNIEMCYLLKTVLGQEFNLEFAENGALGEEKAISLQPDLVLSDIMMPQKNGFELLKDLKTNISTSHIPIILLTAKSDSENKIIGLEQDADDYISKPFDPKELIARVHNILRQRKRLQKRFSENPFIRSKDVKCTPIDAAFIDKTLAILEKNFANNDFTVPDFCEELALNRNSVHNKLKALANQSASQYIKNFRLEKAVKILLETDISITDIYIDTGFNTPQTFNKYFKEKFGITPTEYRLKNRI